MSAPTAAPTRHSQPRSALIVGFVLVLIGGGALVSELLPDYDRYVPLLVGLGLLAVFLMTRSYVALVFAAILTGIGAGLLVADLLPGTEDDGPGAVLGLAFGFLGIWAVSWLLRLKEHHFWPLIPGGILALVGTGLVLDLFETDASKWVIPAVVVTIGVLVMAFGFLRMSRESPTED
jgi:UDP-N-acetylmuramyl pentapeptide phosphotransferase/UDP-N-acetylglucosamine-1-phosphate transferase